MTEASDKRIAAINRSRELLSSGKDNLNQAEKDELIAIGFFLMQEAIIGFGVSVDAFARLAVAAEKIAATLEETLVHAQMAEFNKRTGH